MAALPKFRRIQREDIKDAPNWVNGMLYILNGFMEGIYLALSHNLTFSDNIASFTKTFQVKAGAAALNNTTQFSLPTSFQNKPQGCVVINVANTASTLTPTTAAVFVSWRFNNSLIVIDAISGLTSGQTYNISVLVF